jgi:hypothetical protein
MMTVSTKRGSRDRVLGHATRRIAIDRFLSGTVLVPRMPYWSRDLDWDLSRHFERLMHAQKGDTLC